MKCFLFANYVYCVSLTVICLDPKTAVDCSQDEVASQGFVDLSGVPNY